jgi:DNA gyrase subunit A
LRRANRGDIGTQVLKFANKNADALAGMVLAPADAEVALVTNTQRVVRVSVETVPLLTKDGASDRILAVNPNEKIICVTNVAATLT